MSVQRVIDDFLVDRRIVLMGVSVTASDPSRMLLRALTERGHDLIPIRPGVAELDGQRAYGSVWEVPDMIDTALIMTPTHQAERAVFTCIERDIHRIWIDPGGHRGSSQDAIDLCHDHDRLVLIGGNPLSQSLIRRIRRDSGKRTTRAA